jgi:hypothetical protein
MCWIWKDGMMKLIDVENNRYVVFKRNIHGEDDVNGFSSTSYISFMKEEEIWEWEI